MVITRTFVLLVAIILPDEFYTGSASWAQYGQGQYGPGQYGPGQYGPGQYGQGQYEQWQYGQAGFQGGTGSVERCSLSGINPADHPDVFGNAAVAKSYGFVQSKNGSWHVSPNCRRR